MFDSEFYEELESRLKIEASIVLDYVLEQISIDDLFACLKMPRNDFSKLFLQYEGTSHIGVLPNTETKICVHAGSGGSDIFIVDGKTFKTERN